jgi:hypothetical protein
VEILHATRLQKPFDKAFSGEMMLLCNTQGTHAIHVLRAEAWASLLLPSYTLEKYLQV